MRLYLTGKAYSQLRLAHFLHHASQGLGLSIEGIVETAVLMEEDEEEKRCVRTRILTTWVRTKDEYNAYYSSSSRIGE